jgi:S1-C subfamily serine protease
VHLLTHTGRWLSARALQYGVNTSTLTIRDASDGIEGGDSGGPVVTEHGELLGVLSIAAGVSGDPLQTGSFPHIVQATPAWVLRRMLDPTWEGRQARKEAARWRKKNPQERTAGIGARA